MNERIRELAHEAGLPTYNPEGVPTKLEKFAELIVRECIQRCEDIGSELHARGSYAGDGAFKCAVDLEKHFGVEE